MESILEDVVDADETTGGMTLNLDKASFDLGRGKVSLDLGGVALKTGGELEIIGGAPRRDNVATIDAALAGLTTDTCECAENVKRARGAPCASSKAIKAVEAFVASEGGDEPAPAPVPVKTPKTGPGLPTANTPEAAAVREAAGILGCTTESCVIAHPRTGLSRRDVTLELEMRFKAAGPRDSLGLLSNYNIDETLRRWARVFPGFYPCPFAMMDFDRTDDLFGRISLADLIKGDATADLGPGIGKATGPFSTFGCVLNTDSSTGPGKHWVAVFADFRGKPYSIEYFNSAGRPPPKPVVGWLERQKAELLQKGHEVITVPVTDMDHQEGQTECGLYALYYIRRRLEGTPYTFFFEQLIPDAAMTEFRKHVFRG